MLQTNSGIVILIGIVVCLLGIAIAGMAGMSKEREMDEEQKKALIKEFNFKKGILVATFSGIFSASMAFATRRRRPDRQTLRRSRHAGDLERIAEALHRLAGRIHLEFHLVRVFEHQEQDRISIFQPDAAPPHAVARRRADPRKSGGCSERRNGRAYSRRRNATAAIGCRC